MNASRSTFDITLTPFPLPEYRERGKRRNMPEPRITDVMLAHAQSAVDYARKRFRYELDFTPDSLEKVDRIITATVHETPRSFLARALRRGRSEEEVWNLAKMLGGYAGEVLRRQWGGRWRSTPVPDGKPDVYLEIHGVRCRPVEEVHKRLLDSGGAKLATVCREIGQQMEKIHAPHATPPPPDLGAGRNAQHGGGAGQ